MTAPYKPPTFSTVQVAAAWLIGLLLGAGAFGARNHSWRVFLLLPCVVGAFLTLIATMVFVGEHWSDHE